MASTASAIRPGLRENRTLSGSPHTPSRFISSNFSSPGSTFRQEEDAVIFDLDTRRLLAGFEGESGPQCRVAFTTNGSKRVGDYRIWQSGYRRKGEGAREWSRGCDLWQNDLKDVDLGLMEDRLERAVREVYYKHLVTDPGTARLVLVLPSLVPHPVLSSILDLLFQRWKYPTITILPAPTMAIVSAGLRSALVIDVGWEEIVLTPVYEYRELPASRSTRSFKCLISSFAEMIKPVIERASVQSGKQLYFDFDTIEDVLYRILSCMGSISMPESELDLRTESLTIADTSSVNIARDIGSFVDVDWPAGSSSHNIQISRSEIQKLVLRSMFADDEHNRPDDHETSLGSLIYKALLGLNPDVRSICMARLIFVGDGAQFSSLQHRATTDVKSLIGKHGWTAVRGNRVKASRGELSELSQGQIATVDFRHNTIVDPDKDYVEEKVQKQRAKEMQASVQGELRVVNSLGAWAGASLLSTLKVKGVVEIEKEKYLSHGLSGASRDTDISMIPQRSSSYGVGTTKTSDRASWTLAGWG